ncbi:MAG: ribosome maturation factor RimP [Alcaligenaceae bacterium]|nr:ribosome maturation factor RimP [Alcaligenaceae bacterium]
MDKLFELTQEAIMGFDVELVDVAYEKSGLLVVTLDKEGGIQIEDCEQVSRHLSRVYEVENVAYQRLEVGSPGINRPLKRLQDYQRFVGERVQIKLREAFNNQKVFTGVLGQSQDSTEEDAFSLLIQTPKQPDQLLEFSFHEVEKAKLDPVINFKKGKK